MQEEQSIISILWRYSKNEELSGEEKRILNHWLDESKANKLLFDELSDRELWQEQVRELQKKDGKQTWEIIEQKIREQGGFGWSLPAWTRYAAAAIMIFLLLLVGEKVIRNRRLKNNADPAHYTRVKQDIQTGSQYAVLSINGYTHLNLSPHILDSLKKSGYAPTGNDSTSLSYNKKNRNPNEEINILTTPKGSTFQIELSDGTKIWMNTGSSLTYPSVFSGSERKVRLSGEAYFEVAKNPEKPFIVQTDLSAVKVLGTHFNVEAYKGASTTLLEGSVYMNTEKSGIILKSGEQGTTNGTDIKISAPDLEQVLAWRKNNFWFSNAGFPEIMEKLARWYPMQVVFEDSVKGHFSGILPRDRSLSKLLDILEGGGHVQFTIDGDKVMVRSK